MINLERNGVVVFTIQIPGATRVELVGAFGGWMPQTIPMIRQHGDFWTVSVEPGVGAHLFRYLVDGQAWVLDPESHGTQLASDGEPRSRVWCPPVRLDADSIAA